MPSTEGRLARVLKWKVNRPSSVTASVTRHFPLETTMSRVKFSLRTLLLLTFLFALLAFAWANPPRNYARIEVDGAGMIALDGETVDTDMLKSRLKWRHRWLSIWHREPHIDFYMEKEWFLSHDPHLSFLPLVKTVKDSGFAEPTMVMVDNGQVL